MAYYRNNYEAYYRRVKNNAINSNLKEKNNIRKKSIITKIIIYDLSLSLVLLIVAISLKSVQIKEANDLYSDIKIKVNEKNETLENYNNNFYNDVIDVFNNIVDSNDNN